MSNPGNHSIKNAPPKTEKEQQHGLPGYLRRLWAFSLPLSPLLKAVIWVSLGQLVIFAALVFLNGQLQPILAINFGELAPLQLPLATFIAVALSLLLAIVYIVTGIMYSPSAWIRA